MTEQLWEPGAERPSDRLTWLAGLVLLLVAAGLRYPALQLLPKLGDEMRDAIFSIDIARGSSLPLANFSSYDGALFNYLQALVLMAVGPDLEAPRWIMFWCGLITIGLTYWAVQGAYGRQPALLAAAMLALTPVHVLVNSRVAWGNCLTPVFTTAAFGCLTLALRPASGQPRTWLMAPAGLLLGLALQTHPTVLVFLPGCGLAILIMRPGLIRTKWPWLALGLFCVGYANMIAFNLLNQFESITFAQQTRAEYVGAASDFGHRYVESISTLLVGLFRMLGGAVEDRGSVADFLADPVLLIAALSVLAGLWRSARIGNWLPPAVTVSATALLPVVNDRYEPILDGRYLAPLLPLIFGATAELLVAGWRRPWRTRRLKVFLAMVGAACLVVGPVVGLVRYWGQNQTAVARSARLWASLERAERSWPAGSSALLDRDLERTVLGAGSTELLFFEWAFTLHERPYRVARVTPGGMRTPSQDGSAQLVIMERSKRKLLDSRWRVRELDEDLPERGVQRFAYGVYLLTWEPSRS